MAFTKTVPSKRSGVTGIAIGAVLLALFLGGTIVMISLQGGAVAFFANILSRHSILETLHFWLHKVLIQKPYRYNA